MHKLRIAVAVGAPLAVMMALAAAPASAAPRPAAGPVPSSHLQVKAGTAVPSTAAPGAPAARQPQLVPAVSDTTITFSEFPVGTPITDQYQPKGILFGGDAPFITTDAANPDSPVLSGTPLFNGAITGTFVSPNGSARTVGHFSLNVGYIDDPGSTAVTAYSASGAVLATDTIEQTGIVPVTVTVAGIASFKVAEVADEAAGFAIDNVSFPKVVSLAALGDSYSSGEGNPPFDPSAGACDRSASAWPVLLGHQDAAIPLVTDLACSGAQSAALTGSFKGQPAQITQLQNLPAEPDFVTLTMGGNDVGFAIVLADCFNPFRNCVKDGTLARTQTAIRAEQSVLQGDYTAVQAGAPDATEVVVGYPYIFPQTAQEQGTRCPTLASDERAGLNQLTAQLDRAEQSAAQAANVKFVSVLRVLANHELCTQSPWVYPIGLTGGASRGHPTRHGQQAIEGEVQRFIDSLTA